MKSNTIKLGYILLMIMLSCSAVHSQDTLTYSNLPLFFIETNGDTIVADSSIHADMGVIYNGYGELNYTSDPYNDYNGKIRIKKRGSSSLSSPKSSYRLETQDSTGQSINVSLVDLPKENDWVLYGPYSDKSLMRNVLLYTLAEKLGWYGPRTRFCELIKNDEYMGIYVLIEKIKIDDDRVDIAKLTINDTIGDELTGGYILRVDRKEGEGWLSDLNSNVYFEYLDPDEDELLEVQKNYIKDFVNDFEFSLDTATNLTDSSLLSLFDVASFADYIILNELSKNVDAYRLSTYMYKDKDSNDGRLKMGPVWDYNIAFGNNFNYNAYTPENFIYSDTTFEANAVFWFRKLMSMTSFQDLIKCRWEELRLTTLQTDSVFSIIDSCYSFLSEAQERNFDRWQILGVPVWPNYYVGETYLDEINILKQWLYLRMNWLDDNIPGDCIQTTENPFIDEQLSVAVFPNPFKDHIKVKIRNRDDNDLNFTLYDIYGRTIYTHQLCNLTNKGIEYLIDMANLKLENGIYFFSISNKQTMLSKGKLIRKE